MLDKIRHTIQSLVLKIKLKRHTREIAMSSMNAAKTVGVVCLVDKETNWNEIKKVIKEFQEIVIMERCYWIPIYNDFEYDSIHNRIQGMVWAPKAWLYPNDARIVE